MPDDSIWRQQKQGAFEGLGEALTGSNPFKQEALQIGPGDYAYRGQGEGFYDQTARNRQGFYSNLFGRFDTRGAQAWGDYRNSPDATAALNALADAAQGKVPSAAQMQMQQGLQQSLASQQSAAAGARGGPGAWAAAQRLAANNMAGQQQDMTSQMGIQRAQEMAQARGEYAQAAFQKRAQDLQAAGLSWDQALHAAAQGDQQQLGLFGLGQHAAGADMQGRQNYADWLTAMYTGKDRAQNQAGQSAIGAVGSFAGSALAAASDIRMKKDIALEGLADVRDRQVSPYAAPYSSKKGDADPMAMLAASAPGPGAQYGAELGAQGITKDPNGGYRVVHPNGQTGHATTLAGAQDLVNWASQFPDMMKPQASGTPSTQMLDAIKPVSFAYKADPSAARRYGVMAQDLEKSPMGASLVRDTPSGKMVDAAQGTMAALHALADMHERVKRLEGTKQTGR